MEEADGRPMGRTVPSRSARSLTEVQSVVLAIAVAAGAWSARPVPAVVPVVIGLVALIWRRPWVVIAAAALLAGLLADRALAPLRAVPIGELRGLAEVRTDPETVAGAVRVVLELDGHRYEAWGRGPTATIARVAAGDRVVVAGTGRPLTTASARVRHIGARLTLTMVGDRLPGTVLSTSANRVRDLLERGSQSLGPRRQALFLGLTLGDDRRQPVDLVASFRASGLAHLTAVSGQNVAFVLAMAAPLLTRLARWPRLVATLGLVGWFAVCTRAEPSVVRAGVMAAIAALAVTLGRQVSALRLVALAVSASLLIDPLLVRSVGFALSAGACVGLAVLARPLADRLPGPRPLIAGVATTAAAQIGTAPVALAIFGPLPLVAPIANVLAGPPAGALMGWGLTVGLVAGVLPAPIAALVHLPTRALLWWIDLVATASARAPLGSLDARQAGVITAALVAVAFGRVLVRRAGLAAACVCLVLAAPVGSPVTSAGSPVPGGARLWSRDGVTIVVLDRPTSRLLDTLRRLRVRRAAVVVERSAGPDTAAIARAIPAAARLGTETPDGTSIRAGPYTVVITGPPGRPRSVSVTEG